MFGIHRIDPSYKAEARFPWTLAALAAVNLAVALATAEYRLAKPFGFRLGPIINGGLLAQLAVLGIVAALLHQRFLIGLVTALNLAFLRGLATWTKGEMIIGFVGLDEGLRTLAVVATLQGLRLVTGWRLTKQLLSAGRRKGQFQLAELLAWTTTVGVWLGCLVYLHSQVPEDVKSRIGAVDYFLELVPFPLMGVPVALALLAEKPPGKWHSLALALWCLLIALGLFFTDLRHGKVTVRVLLQMLPGSGIPYLTTFLAVIVLNSLALRWLGYRWYSTISILSPARTAVQE
jgi:hypothetical protein